MLIRQEAEGRVLMAPNLKKGPRTMKFAFSNVRQEVRTNCNAISSCNRKGRAPSVLLIL